MSQDLFNPHTDSVIHSLTPVSDSPPVATPEIGQQISEACQAWLAKSPSADTRSNYERDVRQFLAHAGIPLDRPELIPSIRPRYVAAWRDDLIGRKLTNSSIRRKMTVLRSMFSYLQSYGYLGINPAHSDFVDAPAVSRDGKTVALSPRDCRRLLDAPPADTATGIRDRALFAVLAYTGCRIGELVRLRVASYRQTGVHRVLEIFGKGGKERVVPLHPEAAERLEAWIAVAGISGDRSGPLFRPAAAARGDGSPVTDITAYQAQIPDTPKQDQPKTFTARPLTRRAVQKLAARYVTRLTLDSNVTVHSFRVTALTTAREQGSDIIDLQDFAGHADPRTTLTYIRSRDRLSKSPAYVLKY
jgi:integrase/recombinase XerD